MRGSVVIMAALAGILLTACTTPPPTQPSSTQEESTMDHVEAKAQLDSLLETAQGAIGGEWERSDSGARDCALGGGEGATYLLSRIGPGVEDAGQQAIIDTVVADWAAKDVDAVVTTKPEVNDVVVTQVRYPASGVDPDGFYVELWISDRASSVSGQTRCASGDAAEINAP